jgi:hypothetical protein
MPPRPTERYDVPDDAAGRVRYVEQPVILEHPSMPQAVADPAAAGAQPAAIPRADEIAGWVAVGALAVVLLVVFIVGMRLTS